MTDGKTFFASVIALGFLVLTGMGYFVEIPAGNVKTVDGAMVALGTALGAAVMALLRNSKADDVRAENTGKALDTIGSAINAGPPMTDASALREGDTVTMEKQP